MTAIPLSKEDQGVENFTFSFTLALSTQSPLAQGHKLHRVGLADYHRDKGKLLGCAYRHDHRQNTPDMQNDTGMRDSA